MIKRNSTSATSGLISVATKRDHASYKRISLSRRGLIESNESGEHFLRESVDGIADGRAEEEGRGGLVP